MFQHLDIKGADLPPKTVCLTYDDGPDDSVGQAPGPRTAALGAYLFKAGIQATFFVIGRHAERHPDVLAHVHRCGHSIGNHTYTHPGLVALTQSHADDDLLNEIALTDAAIALGLAGGPSFFERHMEIGGRLTPRQAQTSPIQSSRIA